MRSSSLLEHLQIFLEFDGSQGGNKREQIETIPTIRHIHQKIEA